MVFRSGSPDEHLPSLQGYTIFDLRNADEKYATVQSRDENEVVVRILDRPLLFPERVWADVRDNEWTLLDRVGAEVTSIFSSEAYSRALYDKLEDGGLSCLYRVILRTSLTEVSEVVEEIITSVISDDGGPILINCAKGKDRTGIVCAFLHLLAGVDEATVVSEYAESEKRLKEGGEERKKKEETGLDWSKFRGSPANAMRDTIDFIRENDIMRKCNFDTSKVEAFKSIINNS
ncbi:hypothetical protein TrST_g10955 [Triparma strigata]|uniref:Tyrosine specific protein phosphatases domain-containing protein n=1 Tax=Triparma strigata TaxID=1606541 RepID=A0A9W7BVP4_9STRA|nr:hypothetical protein TrST_g10955 [Triparma strigata]